ncbi:MAG: hypothetical protein A3H44_10515 [Gammaproteobacteria bacterium RIFCSPLOWO2_02_FULL_57_10]|nr:MAG: hypothetical protein A3H44_10515 [Gammaproteobacteria bacterium RIFCSPLOWO2_02_FULL_57_10]
MRGEGTKTSDLDIVIVHEALPNAYRDSYYYGGWPIEAFVHDPQTLEYFFQKVDAPSGVPSLAAMVSEGIELPLVTALSQRLKDIANGFLQAGPARWSAKEIDSSRYIISDLIEDLREPRSQSEMYAIAIQLYNTIANHFFRSKGLWSAKGKTIPRQLRRIDETFAGKFESAFESVFARGKVGDLIALADDLLSVHGGFLFEGHRLEAPQEWKVG